jgi:hypothetical protein
MYALFDDCICSRVFGISTYWPIPIFSEAAMKSPHDFRPTPVDLIVFAPAVQAGNIAIKAKNSLRIEISTNISKARRVPFGPDYDPTFILPPTVT